MKKIALLTAKNLDDHVVDEDHLEKALSLYEDVEAEYVVWDDESIDWSVYDMVIVRTTWDYTKQPKKFLAALKRINGSGVKLLNPYKLIEWNIDKSYMRALAGKGVSTVESFYFDEEGFKDEVASLKTKKFVVKPRVGASAEGVKVLNLEELLKFNETEGFDSGCFAQPYVEEIHQGELSYFFFKGEYKYSIRKTPKEGDFRVQEEHGGIISEHEPLDSELVEAKKTVEAVKEFGSLYLRVDAVLTEENGWRLMELEAIEPSMFFRVVPNSAKEFAKAIMSSFT